MLKVMKFVLFFSLVLPLTTACSMFGASGGDSKDSAFFSSATATENPTPVPAEIAVDIAEIMRGNRARTSSAVLGAISKVKSEETTDTESKAEAPAEEAKSETGSEQEPQKVVAREKVLPPQKGPSSRRPAGATEKYKVKNGDTLMKIAFEKYGNVYRWREVYNTNKSLITDYNNLVPGTVLTIAGVEYVVTLKNGKPYLIIRNDTLVKISNSLYGTPSGWRGLWYNNPQLIHNPNKIYAGFTLYYPPFAELPSAPAKVAQSGYSNQRQQQKLKYIQSLRQPASTK